MSFIQQVEEIHCLLFLKFSKNTKFLILFFCHFKYSLALKPLGDSLVFSWKRKRGELGFTDVGHMKQQELEWDETEETE